MATPSNFGSIISGGTVMFLIGESQEIVHIHKAVLAKLSIHLMKDSFCNGSACIALPDVPMFAFTAIVEYLYVGDAWTPFPDLPTDLASKIAVAQTHIVATKWGVDGVVQACTRRMATLALSDGDQLEFWKFVYRSTERGSAIRIPAIAGLTARRFVKALDTLGLVSSLKAEFYDLVFDLLMLAVNE